MKISIHQPEHFPYEGFFQKMSSSDYFVILDNVKYRKNYFQNRNRFLNTNGIEEWFGVSVPKKSTSMNICDVMTLDNSVNGWRDSVLKKIKYNLSLDMSETYRFDRLVDINMSSIEWCKKKLGIDTQIVMASSLGVKGQKSELLLNICLAMDAKSYISGPSGIDYLDMDIFKDKNVDVEIFQPDVKNYYSMLYNIALSK
jgi:hypothetical protein